MIEQSIGLNNEGETEKSYFICKTCINYVKKGKIAPMSVANNLKLKVIEEAPQLSELENNLISQNIIFQKVFQ